MLKVVNTSCISLCNHLTTTPSNLNIRETSVVNRELCNLTGSCHREINTNFGDSIEVMKLYLYPY